MIDNACFKIENMTRVFGRQVSLWIPELTIPHGEMTFVVGKSGCGKTTLLETLGTLSHAWDSRVTKSRIWYIPEYGANGLAYSSLWLDENRLNAMRMRNFSFMFQRPNLVPMFSPYLNVAMAMAIQRKVLESDRKKNEFDEIEVKLAKILGWPLNENTQRRLRLTETTNTLSVGEKMRVSFLRSTIQDFNVLFADEPTGNLDPIEGNKLMRNIRITIDSFPQRSAIIVTHSLEQALLYADRIIVINRNGYTTEDKDHVYLRANLADNQEIQSFYANDEVSKESIHLTSRIIELRWPDLGKNRRDIVDNLRNKTETYGPMDSLTARWNAEQIPVSNSGEMIFGGLQPRSDQIIREAQRYHVKSGMPDVPQNNHAVPFDRYDILQKNYDSRFRSVFRKGRQESLAWHGRNSILLTAMLLITLLSIAFGRGGLNVLADKMDDPFVRWLEIPISSTMDISYEMLQDSLSIQEVCSRYRIAGVSTFSRFHKMLWSQNQNGVRSAVGRTISIEDPLMEKLISPENLVKGKGFDSDQTPAWILSTDFVVQFCNGEIPPFVRTIYPCRDSEEHDYIVPIPVVGVVKHLPNNALFVTTPFYYEQLNSPKLPLNPRTTRDLVLFIDTDQPTIEKMHVSLTNYLLNHPFYGKYSPFILEPAIYSESWLPGYQLRVSFRGEQDVEFLTTLAQEISELPEFVDTKVTHLFNHRWAKNEAALQPTSVSLYLSTLENLSSLRDYMMDPFKIEISMENVETKNNFHFIAGLTHILGIVIMIVSIVGIAIFIMSIMLQILHQQRVFIGIYTANGITDGSMQRVFMRMLFPFLAKAVIGAGSLAILLSETGAMARLLRLLGLNLEKNGKYFDLLSPEALVFAAVLFATAILVVFFNAKGFLDHSPGDLIYERIGKDKRTSPTVSHMRKELRRNRIAT